MEDFKLICEKGDLDQIIDYFDEKTRLNHDDFREEYYILEKYVQKINEIYEKEYNTKTKHEKREKDFLNNKINEIRASISLKTQNPKYKDYLISLDEIRLEMIFMIIKYCDNKVINYFLQNLPTRVDYFIPFIQKFCDDKIYLDKFKLIYLAYSNQNKFDFNTYLTFILPILFILDDEIKLEIIKYIIITSNLFLQENSNLLLKMFIITLKCFTINENLLNFMWDNIKFGKNINKIKIDGENIFKYFITPIQVTNSEGVSIDTPNEDKTFYFYKKILPKGFLLKGDPNPFAYAFQFKNKDLIEYIITFNPEVNIKDCEGNYMIPKYLDKNIINYFLNKGQVLDEKICKKFSKYIDLDKYQNTTNS